MINDYVLDLSQFHVIKIIGEGSYGKVLLIKNKSGEQFAAKSNKKSCNELGVQKEFYCEIESFLKAKYPTILRFIGHNMFDFNSTPFPTFVTEYMPNSSLLKILDDSKTGNAPFEWDNTKKYINLIGIALGMKHLHSKGIVHRDLKPANILLDENFYPKICDFGLSKLSEKQINELVMNSTGVGTPLYMAPEIFIGPNYNFKVDIYSFGIMAFEIITDIRKPIQISDIQGEQNQDFFRKLISPDPSSRPTFYEICKYIVKKDFADLFGSINFEKVDDFLDLFEEDIEAVFVHAIFLSENGDKKGAANLYKELSDTGCTDAMNCYVDLLCSNDGVIVNKEEAVRYYKMAADKGNSDAMFNYARMLYKGDGISINKEEAVRYYKMAIDKGNSNAMYDYACTLYKGDGFSNNKEEAIRYYKMAIDKGHSDAMYDYACILYYGGNFLNNKEEAARYFKMAADKGNSDAMFFYATILNMCIEFSVNKEEVARYYKMAADKGNIYSMHYYANMLYGSDGISNNKEEAARYYKMAADKGHSAVMYSYVRMIYKGDGILINKKEAIQYCKMAIDKGSSDAIIYYQQMTKIDICLIY